MNRAAGIAEILAQRQIHSLFQPIIDLDSDAVVGYEALARGPAGELQRPDDLFAAAAAAGRLADLDDLCQRAALRGAFDSGITAPLTLFINVEPEVVQLERLERLLASAGNYPGGLQLMLEITERALAVRPAELLATVARLRAAGWRVALDDVGADDLSLAFMPLLRPDVVKLDMTVVQRRPGRKIAEIMNAVNAYAERTGAAILAEGIETIDHLAAARALGATLGQGWWFGRPAEGPVSGRPAQPLPVPPLPTAPIEMSPLNCLPESVSLRRSTKALLVEVSKHLEREAQRQGPTCIVISTFQHADHFTPSTARRYRDLAERVGFVAALGAGLDIEPVAGVRGADLHPPDPIRDEWDIAVLAPHFAAALLARDRGSTGPDMHRSFDFVLTYDRNIVEAATRSLISRVRPTTTHAAPPPTTTAPDESSRTADRSPLPDRPANRGQPGHHPPGAGPTDRARLLELAETLLLEATMNDTAAAVLHLRVHTTHDDHDVRATALPQTAVHQLQRRIRRRDLIAHHNNDYIIFLTDLDHKNAVREANDIAAALTAELSTPTTGHNAHPTAPTITIGISTFPADGHHITPLIHTAQDRSHHHTRHT